MTYQIKLEQFEGPLDLLLQLIEQEKLDITRVSLATVTDQYLEFIGKRSNISLENLSQFLSVASKLILIKSKALLPLLNFSEEEEEEIRDLEHQLAEFKKFKEISRQLEPLLNTEGSGYSKESFFGIQQFFCPPENLDENMIKNSFIRVLGGIPIVEKLQEEIVREVLTLEEKIIHLQDVIRKKVESSFSEIVSTAKDRIEVVVSFLALLELVKQKIIHVEQEGIFNEIKVRHANTSQSNS